MTKQRRNEISHLNAVLCMLVVFIHIVSSLIPMLEAGTAKYNIAMFIWRLSSFAVQGFILLSGMKLFLNKKDETKYPKYLISRIKTIIIPYVLCFLVYYVFYFLKYNYPLDGIFALKHLIFGSLAYHMYFVPLIFQFDLLHPLWKLVVNRCPSWLVVPFCLMLSQILEMYLPNMIAVSFPNAGFIYNDRIFTTYLSYWITGCYIGKHYDEFTNALKNCFGTVCVLFCICLIPWGYYTYLAYNNLAYIPFMNQLHNLYVMLILLMLFTVFVKTSKKLPRLIKLIDGVSYNVYLWHVLFIFLADLIIEQQAFLSQWWCFLIRFMFAYGITVPLCIAAKKSNVYSPESDSESSDT